MVHVTASPPVRLEWPGLGSPSLNQYASILEEVGRRISVTAWVDAIRTIYVARTGKSQPETCHAANRRIRRTDIRETCTLDSHAITMAEADVTDVLATSCCDSTLNDECCHMRIAPGL